MGKGEGLRVYRKGKCGGGRVSEKIRRQPKGGRGKGRGKGTGWVEGLLIRGISEEGPISNIKDESDRSKDDPK